MEDTEHRKKVNEYRDVGGNSTVNLPRSAIAPARFGLFSNIEAQARVGRLAYLAEVFRAPVATAVTLEVAAAAIRGARARQDFHDAAELALAVAMNADGDLQLAAEPILERAGAQTSWIRSAPLDHAVAATVNFVAAWSVDARAAQSPRRRAASRRASG